MTTPDHVVQGDTDLTSRPPIAISAVVTVVFDDGHAEIHSVARGASRCKLIVDLSDEEEPVETPAPVDEEVTS